MTNEFPESKPPRRVRYSGKNPRSFSQKYKELDPQRYPEEADKVLASGKTPAGTHRSIMVAEVLESLAPFPGAIAVDCTLGYGGHALELLHKISPTGKLIGLDADKLELPKTESRLRAHGFTSEQLVCVRCNFAGLAGVIPAYAPLGADLIFADLGISSMQIDDPERGFSFKVDGPLDMRMNPAKGKSAKDLLDQYEESELSAVLRDFGDEPHADYLAQEILRAHRRMPLKTTTDLSRHLRELGAIIHRGHSDAVELMVRRLFQALRIAVNDELGVLDALLRQLPYCLKAGGRVGFLTFHSGEDRRVKQHFKNGLEAGVYSHVSEVIRASAEERKSNPRSTSAKLRFAIRSSDQ
ncbi:16S rRNA (cytosine(1402)-N(4))-methyltransferase RsmH [Planctomicrobium sp. SH668]|uniref:16S rRNA (cytosine(1402)-N(4))-methyltransferase RsmH n=1 Tax=Planctomicrobium sp. SH668 TaxID=3448126 RepID=UPI003F5C58F7